MKKELCVVIPLYNEEECILDVVLDWRNFLTNLDINFDIMVINDGSKDNSLKVLYDNFKKFKDIIILLLM
jgi:undecaprenyl-phosphate 4-deoxy-4-formamido-L-arabinose transferase